MKQPLKLTLGFSPCPNDTFILDALVNHKIDTEGLLFDVHLEDVETLNQWALAGKLDVTKLSFNTFYQVMDHYVLLNAGSALGKGVGPLLIARQPIPLEKLPSLRIAIPGINTTANMLLSFAFPSAIQRIPLLFSEIEGAVLNGTVDAGVIIHENRFTYQQKGLIKLLDLGEYWETKTNSAIPLGGIAIKRALSHGLQLQLNRLIRRSLEHAYQAYPALSTFVHNHAQEMDETVMRQHIDLYVNQYSLDLGTEGKAAIATLGRYSTCPQTSALPMFVLP